MEKTAIGKLRELQLVAAEMLHDLKILCEKNGIRYFLDYGTLLGAVRHKGFIPWDDDIDVTMPYEDYKRFLEIAQDEFGDKYFVQTCDTDINFYRSYTRMRKNGTTFLDTYQKKWDIHHGVWLDIFPIVEINSGLEYKYKKTIMTLSNYVLMDNFLTIHTDEFENRISKFGVKCLKLFYKIPRNKRARFKDKLQSCIFNAKNKKCKTAIWTAITGIYPGDIYDNTCKLVFEGEEYDVPGKYKEKLEIMYGDYMQLPPESERNGHGGDVIIDLEKSYTFYMDKSITDKME